METFLIQMNIFSQEGELISSFSELLTWSYNIKEMEQLILDNLDLKVDPENMIFRFKSNGVSLSRNKTFEDYRDQMESKVTTGEDLGEQNDGEEWVAYIVNAYLCFRDFDSDENLTGGGPDSKFSGSLLKSKSGNNSNAKSFASIGGKHLVQANSVKSKIPTYKKLSVGKKSNENENNQPSETEENTVQPSNDIRKTLEPIFDDDSLMNTMVSDQKLSQKSKRRTKSERKKQLNGHENSRSSKYLAEPMKSTAIASNQDINASSINNRPT